MMISAAACTSTLPRAGRLLLTLGVLLVGTGDPAAAATPPPITPAPAAENLVPLQEVDLMEAMFREGAQLYGAGDYAGAIRAWRTPAERGHPGAQFSLGVAYATGNGVAQSLERAIEWWQAAAAQEHVRAQLNLGLLYWRGEGVAQDLAKARSWWRRAAAGGDPAAQFHLGALAATGQGMTTDYKEAVRWWRLAAGQGYRPAIKGLEILESHGVSVDEIR